MPFLRRETLSAALLLASTAALAAIPAQIKTDKGTVEGESTADGKVMAFKGIPYAAPPIGNLRWAPPAPAEPWTGTRSAHDFGYHCVQSVVYSDMAFHDPGASEDCLTLNVWTPADSASAKLPVMVWIYGGGLSGGVGGDDDHREVDVGELVDAELAIGEQAADQQGHHHHGGEDRIVDGDLGEFHGLLLPDRARPARS